MAQRFRNVAITDFDTSATYTNLTEEPEYCINYMVYQKEKCPKTGKEHFQVYVQFTKKVSLKFIKDIFGDKIHISECKGSAQENINYCTKEESRIEGPWVYGTPKNPGKRSDLLQVAEDIKSGRTIEEIAESNPVTYMKYSKGIKELKFIQDCKNKEWRDLTTYVLVGKTGVGKTKACIDMAKGKYFKLDKANNLWWDGYEGEEVLIIDDFYGWIPFGQLLNILDGYPLKLEIKGSFTWAKWTEVNITSNKEWDQWYPNINDDQKAALRRRLHNLRLF